MTPSVRVSQLGPVRAVSNCADARASAVEWADLMRSGKESAPDHVTPPRLEKAPCSSWPTPCNDKINGQSFDFFYIPGFDLLPIMWKPPAAAMMRVGGPPWLDGSKQSLRLGADPNLPCIVYSVGGFLQV